MLYSVLLQVTSLSVESDRGGSRKRGGGGGGLLNYFIKAGEGAGGVPLPPSRQSFFIISCAKHYIKLRSIFKLRLQELLDLCTKIVK